MIYLPREDSLLLEKYVKQFAKDKSFLDVGSGSGIQSLAAREVGAKKVLALEIDKESIEKIKSLSIPVLKSDLLSALKKEDKFDIIAFNPPYLPEDKLEDKKSALATSGGKDGDEIIIRFLSEAVEHLTKSGFILLLLSSLTPFDKIDPLLTKLGLKKELLEKQSFFMEKLEVWKFYPNQNL